MFGAILGDIIGSPYEFDMSSKSKDFPLFRDAPDGMNGASGRAGEGGTNGTAATGTTAGTDVKAAAGYRNSQLYTGGKDILTQVTVQGLTHG